MIKTAVIDAELQKIKALYTQLRRTHTGSVCDPFNDSDDNWSVIGDDLEADAEASGNEGGRRRRGPAVDAIPGGASTSSLTTERSGEG